MHSKRIIAAVILVLSFAAPSMTVAAEEEDTYLFHEFRSLFRRSTDRSTETPSGLAEPVVAGPGDLLNPEPAKPADAAYEWNVKNIPPPGAAKPADAAKPVKVAKAVADGDDAYRSGNYGTAVRLWRPLADQGDASAQFNLGVVYNNGQGVPKNYVTAYVWFTLSAARGDQTAKEYRDIVAQDMSPAQIAQAQKLAREWKPRKNNASRRPEGLRAPKQEKPTS